MTEYIKTNVPRKVIFDSLKAKGWLFVTFLLVYITTAAIYIFSEKHKLEISFEQYNAQIGMESTLIEAELAIVKTYSDLLLVIGQADRGDIVQRVHQQFTILVKHYEEIYRLYPDKEAAYRQIVSQLSETLNAPSQENLIRLYELTKINSKILDGISAENRILRKSAIGMLIEDSDQLAWKALMLGFLGIFISGIIISIFFTRLAHDLQLLRDWLVEFVENRSIYKLAINRNDELGTVIKKTNEMAGYLTLRETQISIERQKRIFQKKDAAIRNMLSGLFHQLGNPFAILSTAVQNALPLDTTKPDSELNERVITESLERIEAIFTDLNNWEVDGSEEASLIFINERIQQSVKLMQYDERWQESTTNLSLGKGLPALKMPVKRLDDLISILIDNVLENSKDCSMSEIFITTEINGETGIRVIIEDKKLGDVRNCMDSGSPCINFGQSDEEIELNLLAAKNIAEELGGKVIIIRNELTTRAVVDFESPKLPEYVITGCAESN